ncbi:dihydrofolate reductase family protein [soil metagenome]
MLIYCMNVSLDGYVNDPNGSLDWSNPDAELHTWFNDHARNIEASLYGRRLYELMAAYWPTSETDPSASEPEREFGRIWRRTPRYVFSNTLDRVEHNSRLVSGDVAAVLTDVRREVQGDIEVAGPTLAGQFVGRGLVDAYQLLVHPVVLGGGTPFWPQGEEQQNLRLVETRHFASGVMLLSYERDQRQPSAGAT